MLVLMVMLVFLRKRRGAVSWLTWCHASHEHPTSKRSQLQLQLQLILIFYIHIIIPHFYRSLTKQIAKQVNQIQIKIQLQSQARNTTQHNTIQYTPNQTQQTQILLAKYVLAAEAKDPLLFVVHQ